MSNQFNTLDSVNFLKTTWSSPGNFSEKSAYSLMIPYVEYLYGIWKSNDKVNDIELIKKNLPNMVNYFDTWVYPNPYHPKMPYFESVVCKVFWELYH